ncbi:hypothetical protein HY30_17380 [Hyphomonas chukchiensis]|uniref:Uncharacterized protein n=1 Tax=Hyphomonas chukchiensis TaxID=1280947 RepID=A0A062UMB9_9PROT|nr:hypothetical protein HY30_17380 [Hyphomonas chukchiensis]
MQALAVAWLRASHPAPALACFDQLLSITPQDWQAQHGRGLALHALQDRTAALAAFRAVVSRHPDAWRTWGSIADITPHEAERVQAVQGAADSLLRLCSTGEGEPRRHADCANVLLDAHRGREAIAFITSSVPRFKDAATAQESLARAYYELGDFREALRYKQRALSMGCPDVPAPRPQPRFSPDAAVGALSGIGKILNSAGISYFLAAGTLLGFHREGAPLAYDRDVDIGILANGFGSPDVARVIRDHPALMLSRRARPGDRYFAIVFQGIAIDIFVYEPCDGGLHCGLGRLAGDVAWRFTPFGVKTADFQGRNWHIPDDPERYLTETYGPGWQTTDAGFASVLSSPALFRVDPYVRAYYALSRAHKSRVSGDEAKARALLRQSPVPVELTDPGTSMALPPCADRDTTFFSAEKNEEGG